MFLKRLEIAGFKSFAEKIHIDFVPGVTAIVGPNGSGKSNIIDAIRWVLGEQSAKSLRGSKMEDVIFAGSDSRRAVNFAEVTLILDNTQNLFPLDYTEISVSRRVFRSGDSAYLLNGQTCRLKDITTLFMDSGLGKEAFSIISQGRVDEILNSRADERRNVFDEAAGVLKYKTHKQQAEHKLFETTDNLDRVLDILKEIDDRLAPLEKEAALAREAANLRSELREADVRLLHYDAATLQQQISEKTTSAKKDEAEYQNIAVILSKREQELHSDKRKLQETEDQLDHLQGELIDKAADAEKWEGRRLLSLEKTRNMEQQIERIGQELRTAEQIRKAATVKIHATNEKRQKVQTEITHMSSESKQVSTLLNSSLNETEQQIEQLKSDYIERLNEEATVRNEIKHVEERLQGEKSSTEKISVQTELLSQRKNQLREDLQEKRDQKEKAGNQLDKLETSANACQQQLTEGERKLSNQQQLLQKALRKQSEMQGRQRALESLEKDFSGFYSGVKEVLHAKKQERIEGIEGAVVELMTTQPEHAKAIETALGGSMQHIITSTERDARQAIAYLKSKNFGRATFLPLDILKPRELPVNSRQMLADQSGFIGTAFELIRTAAKYESVAKNLLGQTIIASDLQAASRLAKIIGHRHRVVTLDGDIINAGGSLTGGGAKGQSTLFSRKAELETLSDQLRQMEQSIRLATAQISATRNEVVECAQLRDQLRLRMDEARQKKSAIHSSLQETEMEMRSVEMEITTIEAGRTDTETAEKQLLVKKHDLQTRHDALKTILEETLKKLDHLERLVENRREEQQILQGKLHDLQQRLAVLKEQEAYHSSGIMETTKQLDEAEQAIIRLQEEQHYAQQVIGGNEWTPAEIEQQSRQADEAKHQLQKKIEMRKNQRLEQAKRVREHEEHMKETRRHAETISQRLNACRIQLSRFETQYETIKERLEEEYGLRPDELQIETPDVPMLRETVDACKRKLATIGPVNPNAIQEFEEVSERHLFLQSQRNDLVEAKNTLQEAMAEMDQEMKIRFETTFEAIRSHFRRVFKEMFGGGEADLVLTDPANLLTTGIDIVARPPGKKLQNLRLLSGGERALTVISLLFSILEVRPVPFCILDEVEAALDEANVVRYSNYLKKVSEQTQFIVITHRKGTMEGADVLYGITMQESGVSKLLSVKLSEVTEEIST